jgi:Transcriptional regulator
VRGLIAHIFMLRSSFFREEGSSPEQSSKEQTHQAIIQGFLELVADQSRVTVKSVAERAGISRKTFYLHFNAIEGLYDEVLEHVINDFFDHFDRNPICGDDFRGNAERFFLFLSSQPKPIERLICQDHHFDFGRRLYKAQMDRYHMLVDPFSAMDEGELVLVISFILSTAYNTYRDWVSFGKPCTPQAAASLVGELTCNGIGKLAKTV